MRLAIHALVFFCLLIPAALAGDESAQQFQGPRVTAGDFAVLVGSDWSGELRYQDYSSDREVSIPVRLNILGVDDDTVDYRIEYPDEPQYDSDERIVVSKDGQKLNDEKIAKRCADADGSVTIITLSRGVDNGLDADLRITYRISSSKFSIQKEVRPDGKADYFTRNMLLLSRG